VLTLWQLGDEVAGISQRDQLATVGERDRIVECAIPTVNRSLSGQSIVVSYALKNMIFSELACIVTRNQVSLG
jgi:hypothetical protein